MSSIQQLQKWGREYIDRAEVDILIAHILEVTKEFIIAHPEYRVRKIKDCPPKADPPWAEKIKRLITKRSKGIPIAYLTHHKEFFGLNFLVNKHTLIPRPETELIVETVLRGFPPLLGEGQGGVAGRSNTILIDIGTGSGCIPISILKSLPRGESPSSTWATDISKPALKIAQKNAQTHNVDITFLHGNLLEPIIQNSYMPALNGVEGFHVPCSMIITANLPYLTQSQFDTEPSIQHEPVSALVAKDDGLELYKELLTQIKELLNTYSLILTAFFEIDPSQTAKLSNYIQNNFPNSKIEVFKDGMKNDRVIKTSFTIDK